MEYKEILASMLDKLKERDGDKKAQKIFADLKPYGIRAMNREVIVQIIASQFDPKEREAFLRDHPEFQSAYENRLKIP